ncbi:MAG: hypothetical protein JL56_12845 [Desulfotomaculum sp. BICA1-6]|nr:MAG: hypothetical protein JL56_12845 [Desulfotomaculum sp. BICA1-6]
MSIEQVVVTFLPSGVKTPVLTNATLMEAAAAAGIGVNAICGGQGTCGKCRARVVKGAISGATEAEKGHLAADELEQGIVLLCQRKVTGGAVVEILDEKVAPGEQDPGGFTRDKAVFDGRVTAVDPPVVKTYLELEPPTIEDNTADLDRVLGGLPGGVRAGVSLVRRVTGLLQEADYRVTAVTYNVDRGHTSSNVPNCDLLALEKGDTTAECYGIAIDMGTTSVAGYLADLSRGQVVASVSAANRQRAQGADVISRITYVMENADGLERMRGLATRTIDEVVGQLLARAGVAPNRVYSMTLIGNTVMSHLLLGVSPVGMAASPFAPAFAGSLAGTAADLGLESLPGRTRFTLLPNIAGYVGSDTVGVILATEMYRRPGNWLAVDVGTNGEIVLAAEQRSDAPNILACSTAAGPAFEGARISQGMRAEPGAICEVSVDDDIRCRVVGDSQPVGICGSGLVDAVAVLVELGLVTTAGRIIDPADFPPGVPERVQKRIRPAGKGFKFVLADGSDGKREVAITQKDISELQLAKGAIRAGMELLLQRARISPADLDGILLAGAFGSNLRPQSVKTIGMLPDIELDRIKPVGNAAGTGAVLALLSVEQLTVAVGIPGRVEHVELSTDPGFQDLFVEALGFAVD